MQIENCPTSWNWYNGNEIQDGNDTSIIKASNNPDNGHNHSHDKTLATTKSLPTSTWLTSLSSICVISLVGLTVIPVLKGPHQNSLLQLLVSLWPGWDFHGHPGILDDPKSLNLTGNIWWSYRALSC